MYENLKDKFVGIKDELAELGFGRIEVLYINFILQKSLPLIPVYFQVLDNAFKFVKKDDKPGNLIYVQRRLEVILCYFLKNY